MEKRRELTPEEFGEIMKNPSNVSTGDLEVSGVVTIFDKDGNVKSKLDIISIETAKELEKNATN